MKRIVLCGALLGLMAGQVGCFKAKPDVEAGRIKAQIQDMETESAGLDEKIRNAKDDVGLHIQLDQAKELLHSRIERLKERLKQRPSKD